MKATTTWNFGQFTITAEADVTPETMVQRLVNYGLTQLLQRVPATNAEYALADELGLTKTWEAGKKAGSRAKRPKGFERGSMEFSDENAATVVLGFGDKVELETGVSLPFKITSIVRNEGGADSPMALAERFVENLLILDQRNVLVQLLRVFGNKVDENGEETPTSELVKMAHEAKLGARKEK
jgi:hypothetical protein